MTSALIIFDLDGTLIDSAEDVYEAANHTLKFYNMKPLSLAEVKSHIGEGFSGFIKTIAADKAHDTNVVEEIFLKFQFFYDKQLLKHTKFYPGAEKFLRDGLAKVKGKEKNSERNLKIGIVSNKPEYQVKIILKDFGFTLSDFVEVYGGDTFEVRKPDPKPLNEIIKLAGVPPLQTIMIGDSDADVGAARGAGTHFIGVTFGYNTIERLRGFGAEHFISHFDDLATKVESLLKS